MRLRSVVAFGIGYLLGTKAGRDRYKELLETGQELSQSLREFTSSSAVAQDVVSRVRQTLGLPPLEHGDGEGGSSGEQGDKSSGEPRVEVVSEPDREQGG
jgi:hypothetical protein